MFGTNSGRSAVYHLLAEQKRFIQTEVVAMPECILGIAVPLLIDIRQNSESNLCAISLLLTCTQILIGNHIVGITVSTKFGALLMR